MNVHKKYKRNYQKLLGLGLSASLLLTSLSGCSEEEVEIVEITFWDCYSSNMQEGSYAESLVESALPVDIQVNNTLHTQMVQVMNLFTDKKIPDVMWYNGNSQKMLERGLTRTIPYDMVKEYAPSFLTVYEENPTLYTTIVDLEDSDNFFALSGVREQETRVANSVYADYFRYDWIQALDIDLGVNVTQISDQFYVADNGLTLEKFEEVMEAFTYGDPDGNGVDDTYGASFESMLRFDLLYSGFNFINGVNESDGEAELYYTTDEFKEFVLWFQEMFSKGYIDENFFYQQREDRWATVENNGCGYFLESSIALNSWAMDRPPLSMSGTDATFLITPGLSNNEGQGTMIKNAMPADGYLCYISNNVDDEKLKVILQTLEYMNFGQDNISLWFGKEGEDWKWEGEFEDISALEIAEEGARVFTQHVQRGRLFEAVNLQPIFQAGSDFWLDECLWRDGQREQYQYKLDLESETQYSALSGEYSEGCVAIMEEYFEKWVYEGLDVEESWEEYLFELDDNGYQEMMRELDKVEPLEDMILRYIK